MDINLEDLSNRLLQSEFQDYWVHLDASSPLQKYPAKQHAQLVAQTLEVPHGLIYLPGAPTIDFEDSDQPRPFRQRRYFFYLSGVEEPDCHLTYDIGCDHLTLFIPKINPSKVIWNGPSLLIEDAYDKYDVDTVQYSDSVSHSVESWPIASERPVLILHKNQGVTPDFYKIPGVDSSSLIGAMNRCRMIKCPHEIQLIRKANAVTAEAHREVLANIHKFNNEAQAQGRFLDACVSQGAKKQAYGIIAAAGENASTLHYSANDGPFEGSQLMCLDAGCEWQCYASDVTRTFPLTGDWPSKESKEIYDLVQEMQTKCIESLAPGVRYLDLHIKAHEIAVKGLLSLGILRGGTVEEILKAGTSVLFFPHGLGHHLGLECHDVSDSPLLPVSTYKVHLSELEALYSTSFSQFVNSSGCLLAAPAIGVLKVGMVVTVEPGIYFSRYALRTFLNNPLHAKFINSDIVQRYIPVGGVRIEDDILITVDGYENLTLAPKCDDMLRIIRKQGPFAAKNVATEQAAEKIPVTIDTRSFQQTVSSPRDVSKVGVVSSEQGIQCGNRDAAHLNHCRYFRKRQLSCHRDRHCLKLNKDCKNYESLRPAIGTTAASDISTSKRPEICRNSYKIPIEDTKGDFTYPRTKTRYDLNTSNESSQDRGDAQRWINNIHSSSIRLSQDERRLNFKTGTKVRSHGSLKARISPVGFKSKKGESLSHSIHEFQKDNQYHLSKPSGMIRTYDDEKNTTDHGATMQEQPILGASNTCTHDTFRRNAAAGIDCNSGLDHEGFLAQTHKVPEPIVRRRTTCVPLRAIRDSDPYINMQPPIPPDTEINMPKSINENSGSWTDNLHYFPASAKINPGTFKCPHSNMPHSKNVQPFSTMDQSHPKVELDSSIRRTASMNLGTKNPFFTDEPVTIRQHSILPSLLKRPPPVPCKVPPVPQKPLAYRHSLPYLKQKSLLGYDVSAENSTYQFHGSASTINNTTNKFPQLS